MVNSLRLPSSSNKTMAAEHNGAKPELVAFTRLAETRLTTLQS